MTLTNDVAWQHGFSDAIYGFTYIPDDVNSYEAGYKRGLEVKNSYKPPTHFLDGSPIPDGYLEKLQKFFDDIPEFTEEDELMLDTK